MAPRTLVYICWRHGAVSCNASIWAPDTACGGRCNHYSVYYHSQAWTRLRSMQRQWRKSAYDGAGIIIGNMAAVAGIALIGNPVVAWATAVISAGVAALNVAAMANNRRKLANIEIQLILNELIGG